MLIAQVVIERVFFFKSGFYITNFLKIVSHRFHYFLGILINYYCVRIE